MARPEPTTRIKAGEVWVRARPPARPHDLLGQWDQAQPAERPGSSRCPSPPSVLSFCAQERTFCGSKGATKGCSPPIPFLRTSPGQASTNAC